MISSLTFSAEWGPARLRVSGRPAVVAKVLGHPGSRSDGRPTPKPGSFKILVLSPTP